MKVLMMHSVRWLIIDTIIQINLEKNYYYFSVREHCFRRRKKEREFNKYS